ncbi:uncharacterized protein LOC111706923 [Eurytemora carolleeae]|uniref:uncharacterized protein LOC111706923 n=1 Tax=Eurytemora carolleeae TaxID=1294199 RepID=UPI000C789ECA|nr:uncharacterized protein LOC111706923 [Eurytemora carolleeae]|eukprot:XP_023335639.1 uncharacterized protein LOC111706923 [Eurytemora affinis]
MNRALYSSLILLLVLVIKQTAGNTQQVPVESEEDLESVVNGFGAAKHFMPLPHTVVGAHCTWQLRLNTVPKRIPETITEVLCHEAGETCGGSQYYSCKQMKAKMLVAHAEAVQYEDQVDWRLRAVRNITINIGCSCVYREPVLLHQFLPGPPEKRSSNILRNYAKDNNKN